MKKYLTIVPLLALLVGCGSKTHPNKLELTVASPAGAPAIALYSHINDSNLDINADATNVTAFMQQGSKDIVVLPTNAGVQLIKKGANYKIAATITFGNFYLASTGNDEDNTLNEGDYVVVFQQNNVPDKLFNYVYSDIVSTLDVHYVNVASDAAKCIITGKDASNDNATVDYALIAEPALTTCLAKNENASQYADIQALYKQKAGDKQITQASVFVNNSADTKKVDEFLSWLEDDVEDLLDNPEVLLEYTKDLDDTTVSSKLGSTGETIVSLLKNNNRLGIGYKDAYENKAAIDNFLSLWPAIGETSEEIYYK